MNTDQKTSRDLVSPEVDKIPFEQAVAELETIVQAMENGQLKLEESVMAYRRGSELLKYCRSQLVEAEKRVQVFEDDMLVDFNVSDRDVRE